MEAKRRGGWGWVARGHNASPQCVRHAHWIWWWPGTNMTLWSLLLRACHSCIGCLIKGVWDETLDAHPNSISESIIICVITLGAAGATIRATATTIIIYIVWCVCLCGKHHSASAPKKRRVSVVSRYYANTKLSDISPWSLWSAFVLCQSFGAYLRMIHTIP